MWLCKAMISPIVIYAVLVWINALEKKVKVVEDRLAKFQQLACLMITSPFPGTPTLEMEAVLNLFLQGEAVKTAYRLHQYGEWYIQACLQTLGHFCSHAAICMQEVNRTPVLTLCRDLQPPSLVWDLSCEIEIQGRKEAIESAWEILASGTVCFMDGSVGATGIGAGLSFYGFDSGGQPAAPWDSTQHVGCYRQYSRLKCMDFSRQQEDTVQLGCGTWISHCVQSVRLP